MRKGNNCGSITKMSGKRSKPFLVRVTMETDGIKSQRSIGCYKTRQRAEQALAEYMGHPYDLDKRKLTFTQVYELMMDALIDMGTYNKPYLDCMRSAYNRHCKELYNKIYREVNYYDMQKVVNCHRNKGGIKMLFNQMDKYAYINDIIDKQYSVEVEVRKPRPKEKEVFTEEDIDILWEHTDNYYVVSMLLYLYSGFRQQELINVKVNLEGGYFIGGSKTIAGKDRRVPIHSRIYPLVEDRLNTYGVLMPEEKEHTPPYIYDRWDETLRSLRIKRHTTHECRHTFRTRLDDMNANRKCCDMLMGHASSDLGTRTYTHKTLLQLKETIELLR